MSGDIVNLRRARKAKLRAAEADQAAQNRASFGRSKAERALEVKQESLAERRLSGHRRESPPIAPRDD